MAGILVFLESADGSIRKASREAAGAGLRLASALQAPAAALVCGQGEEAAAHAGRLGFSKVFRFDGACGPFPGEAACSAAAEAGTRMPAALFVMAATALGRDLSARLAARLDAALATDVVDIRWGASPLTVVRPVYSGKLLALVELTSPFQVLSLRPNAFPTPAELEEGPAPAVENLSMEELRLRSEVRKAVAAAQGVMDLSEAEFVVSGGRGVGGPEGFALIESLARSLSGAVGASRAAVDAGWIPYPHQVGQTGKVVSPVLYIACGISGAIQHFAGMGSSKFILAINKDPEAPIMEKADFSIVGDLFQVIPILKDELAKALKR
jgi:electron transfer flavoprotein alpha subunit